MEPKEIIVTAHSMVALTKKSIEEIKERDRDAAIKKLGQFFDQRIVDSAKQGMGAVHIYRTNSFDDITNEFIGVDIQQGHVVDAIVKFFEGKGFTIKPIKQQNRQVLGFYISWMP